MSRLDALMVREYTKNGETKPAFTKIGAAFPLKSGNGYQVVLDAFPAPVDGQYKILLKEPMQEKRQGYVDDGGQVKTAPLEDDIPW